jgi:hypothetical protein
MTTNRLSQNWKVHLLFGGGFLLAIAVAVAVNFFSRQTFLVATIDAFRQIKPFEYIMFVLFWYWVARGQEAKAKTTFTSLNPGGAKT